MQQVWRRQERVLKFHVALPAKKIRLRIPRSCYSTRNFFSTILVETVR